MPGPGNARTRYQIKTDGDPLDTAAPLEWPGAVFPTSNYCGNSWHDQEQSAFVEVLRNITPIMIAVVLLNPVCDARADTGDNTVWAAPTFDVAFTRDAGTRYGAGVQAGYRRGLTDDWNLEVAASWAALPGSNQSDLSGLAVGPAYVVDAARWTLQLHAAVGAFASLWTHRWPIDLGLEAGVTLEYRVIAPLGIGLRAAYRRLVRSWDDLDGIVSAALFVAAWF